MFKKVPSKTNYKLSYIFALIAGIINLFFGIPTLTEGGWIFVLFGSLFIYFYIDYKRMWKDYDVTYGITKSSNQEDPVNTSKPSDIIEELPITQTTKPTVTNTISASENTLSFKVAGVTYKTGLKSRQVMLKNMYFRNTPPFDEEIEITFERYDYEGELAIGVYANGLQIGNVPAKLVQKFDSYWMADYIADFEVYGGGDKSWGCTINVEFF